MNWNNQHQSICAEKNENCPKQKPGAIGSRRITCGNENQKNAGSTPHIDYAKDPWTRCQKESGCGDRKGLNARRGGKDG